MDSDFKFFATHFNMELKHNIQTEFNHITLDAEQLAELQSQQESICQKVIQCDYQATNLNYLLDGSISDFAYLSLPNLSLLALVSNNRVVFHSIVTSTNNANNSANTNNISTSNSAEAFFKRHELTLLDTIQIDITEPKDKNEQIVYLFEDHRPPLPVENLLCCEFGRMHKLSKRGEVEQVPALLCGGAMGQVYVVEVNETWETTTLLGHVNEIRDIKFPPKNQHYKYFNLVLTCAKDASVILFNFLTKEKIAYYIPSANLDGEMIKIAWSLDGLSFLTVNTENIFKMVAITKEVRARIKAQLPLPEQNAEAFAKLKRQKPIKLTKHIYQTQQPHSHANCFVVGMQFFGFSVLSKDQKGNIIQWVVEDEKQESTIQLNSIRQNYGKDEELIHAQTQFTLYDNLGTILIGGKPGEICIYLLNLEQSLYKLDRLRTQPDLKIVLPKCNGIIKKCFIDSDYKFMVAITNEKDLLIIMLWQDNIFKSISQNQEFLLPKKYIDTIIY